MNSVRLKRLVCNLLRLPIHQVRTGQLRPAELCMQPYAEVMQRHLRGQARLKPTEIMGPFSIKAEGMRELLIHGLHDLAYPSPQRRSRLGQGAQLVRLGGQTRDLWCLQDQSRSR